MKKITLFFLAMFAFSLGFSQADCASALTLTPGTPQAGATTTGVGSFSVTNTAPEVNPCSSNYNDLEYWFQYTAVTTGETLDISVTDITSNYYGVFIIDNCPDSSPTCIAQDTNGFSNADLAVTTPSLTAGTVYYIVMTDWIEGTTTFTMNSTVIAAPTCPDPSGMAATGVTSTTADLTWAAGGTEGLWNLAWNGGADFDPLVDTPEDTATGLTSAMYNATGLTAATTYYIYYQADCTGGDTSEWVGPFVGTTLCDVYVPDYTADMSNNPADSCWEEAGSGDPVTGPADLGSGSWYSSNHNGTPSNAINLWLASKSEWIISPEFDLSTSAPSELKVYVALTNSGTSGTGEAMGSDDEVQLLMTTDGGANWTGLQTWAQGTEPTEVGEEIIYDLTAQTGTVQFAFWGSEGTVDDSEDVYFHVSGFTVREIPSCIEPSAFMLDALAQTTADVSWTMGDSETDWDIVYGAPDFDPDTEGTMVDVSTTPEYSFSSLTADTAYEIYVRADCGGGTSVWVGPLSIYTGNCIPVATSTSSYIDGFTTTGALTNVMNTTTGIGTDGYANYYDTVTVESHIDQTVDFSIDIVGTTVGVAIWADFDNDLSFDISETLYTSDGYESSPHSASFTIPNSVANGDYRLRVVIDYNDSDPSEDACSFNFGRGEAEDYKLTITDQPTDTPDWYNIQWIAPTADIPAGSNTSLTVDAFTPITAYAQVYEDGLTNPAGQAAGIECWIGGNGSNTNPGTWSEGDWEAIAYDGDSGNNDEYKFEAVLDFTGTVYVAARWRLNGGPFVYGGNNGPWDGTASNNIELISSPLFANDDCAGATVLTVNADLACGVVTPGTTVDAAYSESDDTTCFGNANDDVWFSFVATSEEHEIEISNVVLVSGTSTDMYFEVLEGTCGSLTNLLCSDPNTNGVSGLTIGNTYLIRVYSYSDTSSQNFDVCVGTPPPPPANDECSNATSLTALPFSESLDATSATNNSGFITACSNTMNDGVWYTFEVTVDGTVDIVISNVVGWDPQVDLYSGDCGALTCVTSADSGGSGGGETISAQAVTVGTYYINVGYYSGFSDSSEGPFQIDVTGTATLSANQFEIAEFKYFPNPVNDNLSLRAQQNIQNVSVLNMLGQEVLRVAPNSISSEVDMSALNAGAYFVKVTINDTTETIKIIRK